MGMTDSQFKAFIRLVLDDLMEIQAEKGSEKRDEKTKKLITTLQKALED